MSPEAPVVPGPRSRRWLTVLATLLGLSLARYLGDSAEPAARDRLEGRVMGTSWSLRLARPLAPPRADALRAVVQSSLDAVDRRMSTWRPDSELSRLNAFTGTTAVPLHPELAEVLGLALEIGQASGGAFDPTVGPLVRAWGFGPGATSRGVAPPAASPADPSRADPVRFAALRALVGLDRLELVRTASGAARLRKRAAGVELDLSAIAKGYAVDRAAVALEAAGVDAFLLEVGGELVARGRRSDGAAWRVGVEAPDPGRRHTQLGLALEGRAMATSGDYRNFWTDAEGRRYGHTLDPRTGRPVPHRLRSVTVLHPRCAVADAWATALMVLGPEAIEAVAAREGLEVHALEPDGDGEWRHRRYGAAP